MAEKQSSTAFARRRATYIGIAVMMGVLIIVSLCCILHFDFLRRENIYLKQMIAIPGMLFATILFISCCASIALIFWLFSLTSHIILSAGSKDLSIS